MQTFIRLFIHHAFIRNENDIKYCKMMIDHKIEKNLNSLTKYLHKLNLTTLIFLNYIFVS